MPYTPLDQSRVLWDATGPYWLSTDGRTKHYIPPIVAAQYRDDPRMLAWAKSRGFELQRDDQGAITGMNQAPGAGAGSDRPLDFRTGRQWNPKTGQYETHFDWGDVLTSAVGGMLGAGAVDAFAGGAAAPAAFDAAPNIATPAGMAGAESVGALGGNALGVPVGTAAIGAPSVPLGGVKPPPQNTPPPASLGQKLKDLLTSPEGLASAGSVISSLLAGNGTNDATRASEEQARRMQAITEARMRRVDPLHEAVTQLAFSRLPVSSRQGIALPRVALPE